tara:strand:- start:475 stop:798 length:324 start_codon:yes stop_codon:yes gene_type:complete
MRFLFINEGSRGEVDSYIGVEEDFYLLINEFIEFRNESRNGVHFNMHDSDMMEMKFGGLSDLGCFCEMIFDEEDCFKIYLLDDKNEIKSEEYKLVNYVNDKKYDIIK